MRKIIVGAFLSLDGTMQAPGGLHEDPVGEFKHGGWAAPSSTNDGRGGGRDVCQAVRPSARPKDSRYFAAHWPYVGADDPIGPLFDRITKYVATRNPMLKLDWQNSRTLGADVVAAVKKLKARKGRIC